jgi:hypothetical protein
MKNEKAILMRSYNPAEIVNVMKIDKEAIESAKKESIRLSKTVNEEYDIRQMLVYEEGLVLRETARQKNDRFTSESMIDIKLKEGDVLIHTELGYKVSMLPLKVITDKEERLIQKYNHLGK